MGMLKLAAGVAVGYVLGSRAGREKYENIAATARKVGSHPTVVQAQEKVKGYIGTGTTGNSTSGSAIGSTSGSGTGPATGSGTGPVTPKVGTPAVTPAPTPAAVSAGRRPSATKTDPSL